MTTTKRQKLKTVPDHYTSVTPWIISPSSAKLIEFLESAFNAEEVPNTRIIDNDGVIIHVVVKIGDALIMLFDSRKDWAPTPSFLNLYVEDVEDVFKKAKALGAKAVTEITDLWFGEKVCRILDPFGNLWWINQRIEEVDFTKPEEIERKSSTPDAVQGIAYIQKTLDEGLKAQKQFFRNK